MTGENQQYGDLTEDGLCSMCTTHVRILNLLNVLIGDFLRGFCRSLQLCDIIVR